MGGRQAGAMVMCLGYEVRGAGSSRTPCGALLKSLKLSLLICKKGKTLNLTGKVCEDYRGDPETNQVRLLVRATGSEQLSRSRPSSEQI